MKQPKAAKPAKGRQTPRAAVFGKAVSAARKQQQHHAHHPAHVSKATQHARHRAAVKAARTRAKNAKVKKPAKKRGLAVAGWAECCAAEAVAAWLRLQGRPVSDAETLALHYAAGGTVDAPVTILGALEAAAAVWPVRFAAVDLDDPAAVVLGVALPGAHAVCADGACWWSWGTVWAPSAFPDAVVEEAWAVTW